MSKFEIDQPVKCICPDCDYDYDVHGNRWPRFGEIYTVRGFVTKPMDPKQPPAIWLNEIVNLERHCLPIGQLGEIAWRETFFIPLRRTDIAALRAILDRAKVPG